MGGYYAYLLASLPMLHFGAKPSLSFEAFQAACRGLVSDEESALLEKMRQGAAVEEGVQPGVLRAWTSFERILGNELAKVRAARQHKDAAKYLRGEAGAHLPGDAGVQTSATHLAVNVSRHPDILESERMLDAARWERLETWGLGHYFDTEALVLYGLKLLILERWQRIREADAQKALDDLGL